MPRRHLVQIDSLRESLTGGPSAPAAREQSVDEAPVGSPAPSRPPAPLVAPGRTIHAPMT